MLLLALFHILSQPWSNMSIQPEGTATPQPVTSSDLDVLYHTTAYC